MNEPLNLQELSEAEKWARFNEAMAAEHEIADERNQQISRQARRRSWACFFSLLGLFFLIAVGICLNPKSHTQAGTKFWIWRNAPTGTPKQKVMELLARWKANDTRMRYWSKGDTMEVVLSAPILSAYQVTFSFDNRQRVSGYAISHSDYYDYND